VLEVGGEQVSFDATSDAQIQLRERSEQLRKRENSQASFGQDVGSGVEMKERDFSKLDELCGNFYENKRSVFHGRDKSRNVIENKDSYALKAGMLLKSKELGGGRRSDFPLISVYCALESEDSNL
jgi:hypothetical protein